MTDCIFCKIVTGEWAADKIYEDDATLAFLDIHPNNLGHSLVVPKKHSENLYDMDDHSLAAVMRTVQKVALALKKSLGADGINITMNNERAAGQVVNHPHMHVIPRFKSDGFTHWPRGAYKEGEASAVAEKIRTAL